MYSFLAEVNVAAYFLAQKRAEAQRRRLTPEEDRQVWIAAASERVRTVWNSPVAVVLYADERWRQFLCDMSDRFYQFGVYVDGTWTPNGVISHLSSGPGALWQQMVFLVPHDQALASGQHIEIKHPRVRTVVSWQQHQDVWGDCWRPRFDNSRFGRRPPANGEKYRQLIDEIVFGTFHTAGLPAREKTA